MEASFESVQVANLFGTMVACVRCAHSVCTLGAVAIVSLYTLRSGT